MEWDMNLDASGGKIWFTRQGEVETGTLDGILECGEGWLIRFQVAEHRTDARISEEGEEVLKADVTLRSPSERRPEGEPPEKFESFCSRLLAPGEGEGRPGYVFTASVFVRGDKPVRLGVNDHWHRQNENTLVEFAHLRDPYLLIGHGEVQPLVTNQWLEGVLKKNLKQKHLWRRLETG